MNEENLSKILNSQVFNNLKEEAREHICSFSKAFEEENNRGLTHLELLLFISGFVSGKIYEKENRSDT